METGTSEGRHRSPDSLGPPGLGPERSTRRGRRLQLQQLRATFEETEIREAGGPGLSILILVDAPGRDLLPNVQKLDLILFS